MTAGQTSRWALGFQHTYEELKLKSLLNVNYTFRGFQHTYEGLKPVAGLMPRAAAISCFQHPYEGLKHEWQRGFVKAFLEFSAYL